MERKQTLNACVLLSSKPSDEQEHPRIHDSFLGTIEKYFDSITRQWLVEHLTDSNIVFVDSPAGVGYSYSNTSSDYNYFSDELTG